MSAYLARFSFSRSAAAAPILLWVKDRRRYFRHAGLTNDMSMVYLELGKVITTSERRWSTGVTGGVSAADSALAAAQRRLAERWLAANLDYDPE